MTAIITKGSVARTLARVAAGAVFGAGAAMLFFNLVGEERVANGGPGTALGVAAGLVYLLLGLFVTIGAMAPRVGAHFLNVESAEELREQRALLGYSGVASILVGVFLLILCVAGEGVVSAQVAALIAGLCLASIVIVSLRIASRSDELMRRISTEASALSLYWTMVLFGGWAALAHLGLVEWLGPLAWLATLALLELAATCWVCGKRGLLTER